MFENTTLTFNSLVHPILMFGNCSVSAWQLFASCLAIVQSHAEVYVELNCHFQFVDSLLSEFVNSC